MQYRRDAAYDDILASEFVGTSFDIWAPRGGLPQG